MQKYSYHLVDVFTDQPFGGNQLAVFLSGQHLTAEQMQRIARELNLSETTFVLPAKDDANDFWVRIFTPSIEMQIAGHPTVGTAYVLAKEGFIDADEDEDSVTVKFEEGVGVIPVKLEFSDGIPSIITMFQPIPRFDKVYENRDFIAQMLSISADDLLSNYPVRNLYNGQTFTYIPVKSLDVIKRVKLHLDLWEQHYAEAPAKLSGVFVFTPETERPDSYVHSRMFAPPLGIPEDPATGAASGPLGCYLVKYGLAPAGHIIGEQGFEMGRPSIIHITIEQMGEDFTLVGVGGQSVAVGEGYFYDDLFD
jgi:trans-2,3-dihydro-3-hydroxyanthranilate isomerase